MHESVPQPRCVSLSSDEEDYDVYYFYPSRNRVYLVRHRLFPRCSLPLLTPRQPASQPSPFGASSSADVSVVRSPHVCRPRPAVHAPCHQLSFPSYSYNSDFVFPDPANVHDISTFGYSALFGKGLWAQVRLSPDLWCVCTYASPVSLHLSTTGCLHRPNGGGMSLVEEPLPSSSPTSPRLNILNESLGERAELEQLRSRKIRT